MPISKPYLALIATCLFWGSTWVVAKMVIHHLPVLQVTGIRQILAGTIILLYFSPQLIKGFDLKRFWRNFYTGFFLITLSNGLSTLGIKYIPSGLGALIGCFFPIVLVLFNFIVNGQKVSVYVLLSMLLALVGIGIIFLDNIANLFNPEYLKGIGFCLSAVVTWTIGTMINHKRASTEHNPNNKENIYENLGWQMFTSGVTTLIFSYGFLDNKPVSSFSMYDWGGILYLIVFGSIVSFLSYIYVLKTLPIQIGSLYAYINPIVALILGHILLSESLNLNVIIGAFVTLTGVYLVKRLNDKIIRL